MDQALLLIWEAASMSSLSAWAAWATALRFQRWYSIHFLTLLSLPPRWAHQFTSFDFRVGQVPSLPHPLSRHCSMSPFMQRHQPLGIMDYALDSTCPVLCRPLQAAQKIAWLISDPCRHSSRIRNNSKTWNPRWVRHHQTPFHVHHRHSLGP